MTKLKPILIRDDGRRKAGYRQPVGKQVALFCYLADIMWKLACRIPWRRLGAGDYQMLAGVGAALQDSRESARRQGA